MFTDTHCHLQQFANPAAVLKEAAQVEVTHVATLSETPASMATVLALKDAYPTQVSAGIGIHPTWVTQHEESAVTAAMDNLEQLMPRADLLGEIGLDHKWATTPRAQDVQEEALDHQLALAAAWRKPVNLHSRRCPRQTMNKAIAFHSSTGLGVQLHWFTQSKKLVRLCNEAGIYISVGPTIIDGTQTQEIAGTISEDLLLLETDAPITVGDYPGHPRLIRDVAATLADLKGWSLHDLAEITTSNFSQFLGAPCHPTHD